VTMRVFCRGWAAGLALAAMLILSYAAACSVTPRMPGMCRTAADLVNAPVAALSAQMAANRAGSGAVPQFPWSAAGAPQAPVRAVPPSQAAAPAAAATASAAEMPDLPLTAGFTLMLDATRALVGWDPGGR